jgi:hypothetical protein
MERLRRDERPMAERTMGAMTTAASATMREKIAMSVNRRERRFSFTKLRFSFSS